MTCAHPILIKPKGALSGLFVPCGKCVQCRIQRAREFAVRVMHESGYWDSSLFLTLTYNDDYLPSNGSISKRDLQLFIKRFRKHIRLSDDSRRIKYFACGEYGELYGRPHYHMIVFGAKMDDFSQSIDDYRVYTHPSWVYGNIYIGNVTYESARYVARYIDKQIDDEIWNRIDNMDLVRPFRIQSGGLGLQWAEENEQMLVDKGYLTELGVRMGIPRYYRNKLELEPNVERAIEHELDVKTYWRNKLNDIRYIRRLDDVGVTEDWIIGMAIKRARNQSELNALHLARNRKRKDV